jgi:hypothetical protein
LITFQLPAHGYCISAHCLFIAIFVISAMSDDETDQNELGAVEPTETSSSAKPKRWSRSENEEYFINIMIRCEVFFVVENRSTI